VSFAHQSTPPCAGVTVHADLTGLDADDHEQYALADKTRPDPWVAAADVSPRSLADLGTKDHDLLDGLTDDDHSIYALLAGRSGGQTFVGGIGSGDKLGLTCRSGAVAGLLELKETSPHLALTGDLDVSQHLAVGATAAILSGKVLSISESLDTHPAAGLDVRVTGNRVGAPQFTYGISGVAYSEGTPTAAALYGLYFDACYNTAGACSQMGAIYAHQGTGFAGTGAVNLAYGIRLAAAGWLGSKPATAIGIAIEKQAWSGVGTAYGLDIVDQTATTVRLLELGPAVPYLRLVGGADPPADKTNLYLKCGSTLRRVIVYANYLKVE